MLFRQDPTPTPQRPGAATAPPEVDPAACPECESGVEAATAATDGTWAEWLPASLVDTSAFPARWFCGTWSEPHGWLHILSDLGIFLAYVGISVTLLLVAKKRGDMPFPFLIAMFGGFILLCGVTHLFEALMFWWPAYRMMGITKLLTAAISLTTAVVLVRLVPGLLALKGPGQLQEEVERRTLDLRKSQEETERARAAAELAAAAKSAFLANMSHEIRTPLNAILGFAELLKDDELDPGQSGEVIQRNGDHLLRLLNDVLDSAKMDAGQMSLEPCPVGLSELLGDAVELMGGRAQAKGISLTYGMAADVPGHIRTDPVRLRQILLNLLGNSIKFTDTGGVALSMNRQGDTLVVEVTDTGCGMTEKEAAKIFGAFEQASASTTRTHGGTGLGLSISSRLAELLGGSLRVARTAPGVGSVFRLEIPCEALEPAAPCPAGPGDGAAPGPGLAGRRVLIVDDSPDNRLLAQRVLEKAGAEVVLANNGADGCAAAQEAAAEPGGAFDLMLVDLQMPVLDGFGMVTRLRESGDGTLCIALTADATHEQQERADAAGFAACYSKPIRQAALVRALQAHLPS